MLNHGSYLSIPLAALLILCAAFFVHTASAQESQPRGVMAPLLEEIVVTARKREETVFDALLSVTGLGGGQLEAQKIRGLTDLAVGLPNVALDDVGTTRASCSGAT